MTLPESESLERDEQCHIMLHGLTSVMSNIVALSRLVERSQHAGDLSEVPWPEMLAITQDASMLVQDQIFVAETVLSARYPDYYRTLDYAGNRPSRVNMGALLNDVVSGYMDRGSNRGIDIRLGIDRAAEDLMLYGSESMLRRAINHAMSNALKYSYHGTAARGRDIRVSLRRHDTQGRYWCMAFQNYGVGVDQAEERAVFDPGVRGRMSIEEGRTGAGLGLADVRAVMRAHGGHSSLKSKRLPGEVFLTTLQMVLPTVTTFAAAQPQSQRRDGVIEKDLA